MAASATNFCGPLNALEYWIGEAIQSVFNKVSRLERLAAIIEQAGDLAPLPNISILIPLNNVSAESFEALRAACPFLNLPSFADNGLQQLIDALERAYQSIADMLEQHPWARMPDLQDQVAKLASPVEQAILQAGGYAQCLAAICNTGQSLYNSANSVNTQQQLQKYNAASAAGTFGQVLNQQQQVKVQQWQASRDTMEDLLNTAPRATPVTS